MPRPPARGRRLRPGPGLPATGTAGALAALPLRPLIITDDSMMMSRGPSRLGLAVTPSRPRLSPRLQVELDSELSSNLKLRVRAESESKFSRPGPPAGFGKPVTRTRTASDLEVWPVTFGAESDS